MLKRLNISLSTLVLVSIVIISTAMHARQFSKDLVGIHVWRQTETQTTINNFYSEDMNILHPRNNARGKGDGLHRMEFPLMQWLIAGIYKLLGNHLIITRIFMFITGLFSVFGIYKMIKYLLGDDIPALIGAWAFNFSPSFYYYTINPMPDNFALCFGIWGIAMFFLWIKERNIWIYLLSGLFLGIAALTKLPFILYFIVPVMYFLLKRPQASSYKPQAASHKPQAASHNLQPSIFNLQSSIINAAGYSLFMLPAMAWYITVMPEWNGNGVIRGVFDLEVPATTLLGNFSHHLFITLPELLLNYGSVLFFLAGFYFFFKNRKYKDPMFPFLLLWGMVLTGYFLFELNMIRKSHDYYLFPFLPLLFIIAGYGAWRLYNLPSRPVKYLVIFLLCILPLTAALRIDNRWNTNKPGFNRDLLTYKNELREAVPNNALCVAGNDQSYFIFFYYIDKKGWGFDNDKLDDRQLKQMISDGARYLYCDSRKIDNDPGIIQLLDELIVEKGSFKVYRLKQGFQP